jgi:hypothetical protein
MPGEALPLILCNIKYIEIRSLRYVESAMKRVNTFYTAHEITWFRSTDICSVDFFFGLKRFVKGRFPLILHI